MVALGVVQVEDTGNGAGVDDRAGIVAAGGGALRNTGDAAEISGGGVGGVEGHIGQVHVFNNGLRAQNTEQTDVEVFIIQREGLVLGAEGQAVDGIAAAVEGAVKQVLAAADGRPCRGGDADVIGQRHVLAGVVDLGGK